MPLENYEDSLELSVKQFVIKSSPVSLVHMVCGLYRTRVMQVQV